MQIVYVKEKQNHKQLPDNISVYFVVIPIQ